MMIQFEDLPKWVNYDENDKLRFEEDDVDSYGFFCVFLRYVDEGKWGVGYYPEDEDREALFEEQADAIGIAVQKAYTHLKDLGWEDNKGEAGHV